MTQADDIARYDAIDASVFSGRILEVGARHGESQLASRHRERFLRASREDRYLGIDLLDSEESGLNIVRCDLFDMSTDVKYDTILMLEVLEHICLRLWPEVFTKLLALLRPGGHLMITVPYREPISFLEHYLPAYRTEPGGGHVVYGITRDTIRLFLPDARFRVLRQHYPFRARGESWAWAVARFVKRAVRRERLAWHWLHHSLNALLVDYVKEAGE